LPQIPQTDLAYDLTGVEATWQPESVDVPWHGWIPHLDLTAARRFTSPSADHERLWHLMKRSGTLTLRTTLDLRQMLRPEVQPGSKIDFEYPREETTIELQSSCPMKVSVDGAAAEIAQNDGHWTAKFSRTSSGNKAFHRLEVSLRREPQSPPLSLTVSYHTNEDPSPRAMPLRRMLVPWATPTDEPQVVIDNRSLAELEGGNWLRGKDVFFGDKAMCSKCHQMRGEGALLGPDLSNLPQRDYESVLRDITKPSYAMNPDFITQTVITTGGRVLTGSIRSSGSDLFVGDKDAKETRIARDEVEEIHPSSVSVMPEGLAEAIGPEAMCDLLTFLLVEPPSMPDYGPLPPPPPRSSEEVKILLSGADPKPSTTPLRVVLVAGRKDHGPGEHDYPAWQTVWQRLLSMAGEKTVSTANDWPSRDDLKAADVLVFYQQGTWTPERAKDIDRFLARGGGLVYIHYAVDGGSDAPGFAERIGLAWRGGVSKFRHGELGIDFSPGDHPIARNLDRVRFYDESYWNLIGDARKIRLLGSGIEDGAAQPLFWTAEKGKGRVFVSIPGHFAWTFDDPIFRAILLRGIAWSAGESVDRFNDLVTPGARLRTAKPHDERTAR
jgi:putative heme-binding domain-containing protein